MPKGVKMEKYRPKIHFSAEDYIINDPNGLVYYNGEYHLFHQYNINEQIYWGHAVSKDLVRWKRLPKAIAPDKIGQIWSGSYGETRSGTIYECSNKARHQIKKE